MPLSRRPISNGTEGQGSFGFPGIFDPTAGFRGSPRPRRVGYPGLGFGALGQGQNNQLSDLIQLQPPPTQFMSPAAAGGTTPIAPRPGFGPGFTDDESFQPSTRSLERAPRPGFESDFEGPLASGQLQPPPISPRRVQRSFTEGLTAPDAGVGNQTIGSLLQYLFGNF